MTDTTQIRRFIRFHSDALEDETLQVAGLNGTEAISRPYRFELDLLSTRSDLDFDAILEAPAHLSIKQGISLAGGGRGAQTLKFHGVLSRFGQFEKGMHWVRYRAVLVPKIWRMSCTTQSQVYVGQTVPQIVEAELKAGGLSKEEYAVRCDQPYPAREYVVQYLETNLNYVERLCEHDGISSYFVHGDERTQIVFTDAPTGFPAIPGGSSVDFRPTGVTGGAAERDWLDRDVVAALACEQNVVPREVLLKDYNFRSPTTDLKARHDVAEKAAVGTHYEWGNHFKDEAEGNRYAEIRAQEIKCRQRVFRGRSMAKGFRAGHSFELRGHYRPDWNQPYLLLEVWHQATQPVDLEGGGGTGASYSNEFVAIPASEPFRPERLARKPRAETFNAKVDAGGDYAEIDEQGRYKVRLPFDTAEHGEASASRFVRMAQPYAGADYGLHCPLHKGTEVILTHVNGDPDRPIIAAAIPNPETGSPVTADNQTQCRLRTGGGNEMRIEDTNGTQYFHLETPSADSHISLGASHHSNLTAWGITVGTGQQVSITAGQSVTIASGSPNYAAGMEHTHAMAKSIAEIAGTVGSVVATASSIAGEFAAAGHIALTAGVVADLAGLLGTQANIVTHTNVYVSSPTKVAILGGAETLLASGLALDCFAIGSASFIGGLGAFVGSPISTCVVSGKKMEVVSIWGDVLVEAKKVGSVTVDAHQHVTIRALHGNGVVQAKRNMTIQAQEENLQILAKGWGHFYIDKDLHIQSKVDQKIVLEAGNSSITLEKEKITIKSDTVEIESKDGKAKCHLRADGKLTATSEGDCTVSSNGQLMLQARQKKVYIQTKLLDASGAKKIEGLTEVALGG